MVIGVVGLGTMGTATALRLIAAGHEVVGYDIDPIRNDVLHATGATIAGSLAEIAEHCEIVLLWLPSPGALLAAAAGLTDAAHEGLLALEMGTLTLASKDRARAILLRAGVELMDAPVSGSGRLAQQGELMVYASGTESAYERARPVFEVLGASRYVGPFGHGSAMKYIANLLVAVHTVAAAEAHTLAAAAGLDPHVVQEVIADGVGSSRMWDLRGPSMAAGSYDPPDGRLDNLAKDVAIIAEYAGRLGTHTPLLDVVESLFRRAGEIGLGHLDAAAIMLALDGG